MHNELSNIIHSLSPISSKSLEKIINIVEFTNVKKGDQISTIGRFNNLEYFLIEGICKSYLFTPDGEDITISFFMSGSVLSPSTTRNMEGKAIINIRALTNTVMATMNADEFEKLMVADLGIRQFGNTVLRNELMQKVQKEIALASLKGKDRLQLLRRQFPNIENLVPHADIASYLGLTTISLSRLRTQS